MILDSPSPAPAAVCLRNLPPAPRRELSAPVALDAGCGLVVFGPGRRVSLRPRAHISYQQGSETAPGEAATFRDGHVVWLRNGRVLWRSQRTFHPGHDRGVFTTMTTGSSSTGRLAYMISRWSGRPAKEHRLVFVTAGNGRERLVSTTDYPLGWTARGLVTAHGTARRLVLHIWRADGRAAAPALPLPTLNWTTTWDASSNQLYAISRDRVVRTDGVSVTPVARLGELGLTRHSQIMLAPLGRGLIELATPRRLVIFDASDRRRLATSLPAGWRLDGSITTDAGGAVAFESTPVSRRPARRFRLYVVLPGTRPRLLDSYSAAPECAPHGLALSGSAVLLTTSSGLARVYDARGSRPPVDLEPAVQWLKAHHRSGEPQLL